MLCEELYGLLLGHNALLFQIAKIRKNRHMEKIYFASSQIMCIFALDFIRKSNEALYSLLLMGM